jgi:predicted MFS family arabinose efflux permease
MSDDRRLFSIANFRRLFGATLISTLGDGVMIVALPLLAASVSNSNRSVAWVLGFSRMPILLLSLDAVFASVKNRFLRRSGLPWLVGKLNGATLADRADARTVMLASDLSRFVVLAILGLVIYADRLSLLAIYVTAFVLGLLEIPFSAASQRMFPETVPDALLPIANARISAASTAGEQFVGPAVGGLLVRGMSAAPVLGDALSFLGSAAFVRGLPALPPVARTHDQAAADMGEAWRWLKQSPPLRTATLFIMVLGFAQVMVLSLLIPLGVESLGLSERGVGFLIAVVAVGGLVGAAVAERAFARFGYVRNFLLAGTVIAAAYMAAGLWKNAVIVGAALVIEGVVLMFGQVAFNVLRLRLIPADLRGRVSSLTRVAVRGVTPFASLVAGEISARRNPSLAVFCAGALTGAAVLCFGPALRRSFSEVE